MSFRFSLPVLASLTLAAPVLAQEATPEPAVAAEATPLPAERVIPHRQSTATPVFVRSEVVQGTAPAIAPAIETPQAAALATPTMAAQMPPAGATPVYYAFPVQPQAQAQYAYPGAVQAAPYPQSPYPQSYAATAPIPAGSQIVTFDRASWLAACRDRLAGYEDDDARTAAIGALGGAAAGHAAGLDQCESYLDSYMSSATAGTLAARPQYGQQYMLVPVTVMVPQMPSRQNR